MKRLPLAILFSTVALGACASPSGRAPVKQARSLPRFSSIALNGLCLVRVHRAPQAVVLTIDANLVDRYETNVKGSKLSLGFRCDPRTLWATRNLKVCEVDITLPDLDGIELNGAGTIIVDEFPFARLGLRMTGAGSVELRGSAAELSASCTGACKVLARDLLVGAAKVNLTGSGRIEVGVKEEIDASITGEGSILYWGSPRVAQRVSGSGNVRRAGC